MMKITLVLSILLLLFLSGCINQDPKEINMHTDECAYCKMVISDQQFASQIVSDKGKSYPFDSIECMAAFAYQKTDVTKNAKLYAANYTQQGQWLLLDDANIYHAESVKSPMGLSLFALPKQETIPSEITDAEQMNWGEAKNFVVEEWDVKK